VEQWVAPYLAGIIDADGCITIAGYKGHWSIRVTIQMTRHEPLELLAKNYGGRVCPMAPRGGNRKPVFAWNVSSLKAAKLIEDIRPFLHIKGPQADLALSIQAARGTRDWRSSRGRRPDGTFIGRANIRAEFIAELEAAKREMHNLNRRGIN
jgi:hypothetical protein